MLEIWQDSFCRVKAVILAVSCQLINQGNSQKEVEIMKKIPGFPGYYATKKGEIYTKRINPPKKLSKRVHRGYYHVNVKRGIGRESRTSIKVHRLILWAYVGPKPKENYECRHLNGDPLDNRLCNLKWGTHKENMQDQIKHGTLAGYKKGKRHNASKLTKKEVLEIKEKAESGMVQKEIAKEYGIHPKHVSDIKLEKTWKHLW